jgi:hypothetical protein
MKKPGSGSLSDSLESEKIRQEGCLSRRPLGVDPVNPWSGYARPAQPSPARLVSCSAPRAALSSRPAFSHAVHGMRISQKISGAPFFPFRKILIETGVAVTSRVAPHG